VVVVGLTLTLTLTSIGFFCVCLVRLINIVFGVLAIFADFVEHCFLVIGALGL